MSLWNARLQGVRIQKGRPVRRFRWPIFQAATSPPPGQAVGGARSRRSSVLALLALGILPGTLMSLCLNALALA